VRAGSTFITIPGRRRTAVVDRPMHVGGEFARRGRMHCDAARFDRAAQTRQRALPADELREQRHHFDAHVLTRYVVTNLRPSRTRRAGVEIDRNDSLLDERHPVLAFAPDHGYRTAGVVRNSSMRPSAWPL
jgi:hypothetical protein